jgi:hypothetical protein
VTVETREPTEAERVAWAESVCAALCNELDRLAAGDPETVAAWRAAEGDRVAEEDLAA